MSHPPDQWNRGIGVWYKEMASLRTIPIPRELIPRDAIPPIRVEAAVGEVGELGKNVKHTLPD